MSIKAILLNLADRGVTGTYDLHRRRKKAREVYAELTDYYKKRPFLNMDARQRKETMDHILELENSFQRLDHVLAGQYRREVKAHYLKGLGPQCYAKYAKQPVKDKVVFLEKGSPKSAPNGYLSDILKSQGKYQVVMIGVRLRSRSKIEAYENILNFYREAADAKAIFISSANEFLSQFDLRQETKLIQLWHGLGILKKVGYSTIDNEKFGRSRKEAEEYDAYRNYDFVTLPSMEQAWIFEESMHISADSGKLLPIGVSRTDQFYDPNIIRRGYEDLHRKFPATAGKKIILYAPTYRGRLSNASAPSAMNYRAMAQALGDEYVLLIKQHGSVRNLPGYPEDLLNTFLFDMNRTPIVGAIERLLMIADICITDYSSIAFEYALLERPLLFFAYDLDEYYVDRGLYYKYDEITPGPICSTTEELIDCIQHIDLCFDKQKIIDFKNRFVGACDGHATERTIALIEQAPQAARP